MILSPDEPPRLTETEAGLCFSLRLSGAGDCVRWAWLADTHIAGDARAEVRGQYPLRQLQRVVAEVLAANPQGALVNGDIAWYEGARADYERFARAAAPIRAAMPLVLAVGNHDRREGMLEAAGYPTRRPAGRLTAVVDQPPFRFIVLDSQIGPEEVGGGIGAAQLAWLNGVLAERKPVTVLFTHHPGVSVSEGCADFDALLEVAAAHPQVKAIVTGHDHEFLLAQAAGVHLIALPAAGFTFRSEVTTAWVEASLTPEGAVLRLRGAGAGPVEHPLVWRRGRQERGA